MSVFLPPNSVRGMKSLTRELFAKVVEVPAIKINSKQCENFLTYFKKKALRHQGIKGVRDISDCDQNYNKLLLLQPVDLSADEMDWISDNKGLMTSEKLELGYQHFSIHDVLQAVLPTEDVKDVPSSFEQIGHIAHLNLRDDQLPYKELIGEVILDKQPGIETVVNKVSTIDETFRFFKMDVLAGKDDMKATVKENGCTFSFDFSKVYWNSRLHTEHKRIIDILNPGDVVVDMFAGVGPFAVPACRKGCKVYANDLNPHAYSFLISNAEKNKVCLQAYCLDAREFIKSISAKWIADLRGSEPVISHVLMNLPAIAVEFLDVFKGIFRSLPCKSKSSLTMPKIHCYSFSKATDPNHDAIEQVEKHLGCKLEEESYSMLCVRDVSPNKVMMRVSFTLPQSVAYQEEGEEEVGKHQKGVKHEIDDSDVGRDCEGEEGLGCGCPPSAKREKL